MSIDFGRILASALCAISVLLPVVGAAGGTQNSSGDRLLLVTYWGDDKVALIDSRGPAGKEEMWAIDTLKSSGCAKPYDIRSDRRGAFAYASCSGTNKVVQIDIVAQLVSSVITVGSSPRDLQLFDNDRQLIVANSGSDTVSIVDVASKRVAYEVPVQLQPYGVAVVDSGHTALVTGWASGDLHVLQLSGNTGREVRKVDVGFLPYTVVGSADGKLAYVAANGSHAVIGVDIAAGKVVSKTPVGRNPWSLAANTATGTMLVTNNRSNSLTLLRTGTAAARTAVAPVQTINAGSDSRFGVTVARAAKNVTMTADGTIGAFTDLANNQVVIVNLGTGALVKAINVGKAPYGIEFVKSASP